MKLQNLIFCIFSLCVLPLLGMHANAYDMFGSQSKTVKTWPVVENQSKVINYPPHYHSYPGFSHQSHGSFPALREQAFDRWPHDEWWNGAHQPVCHYPYHQNYVGCGQGNFHDRSFPKPLFAHPSFSAGPATVQGSERTTVPAFEFQSMPNAYPASPRTVGICLGVAAVIVLFCSYQIYKDMAGDSCAAKSAERHDGIQDVEEVITS